MATVALTEGWTGPLRWALKFNGTMATSFSTGDTIALILKTRDGVQLATSGNVTHVACSTETYNAVYIPDAADLLAARSPYSARFKIISSTGATAFFPSGPPDVWTVYAP